MLNRSEICGRDEAQVFHVVTGPPVSGAFQVASDSGGQSLPDSLPLRRTERAARKSGGSRGRMALEQSLPLALRNGT